MLFVQGGNGVNYCEEFEKLLEGKTNQEKIKIVSDYFEKLVLVNIVGEEASIKQ